MSIHRLLRSLRLLGIVALVGCSSSLVPSGQGGSGGIVATGGVPGTGAGLATGGRRGTGGTPGTGGSPLDGGAAPRSCGNTVCTAGEYCCDPLCSTCAPVGALCTQGCQIGDAGFGAGACASLKEQYLAALRAAQSCTVGVNSTVGSDHACGAFAVTLLPGDPCACNIVYVTDRTQTDLLYERWLVAGCQPPSSCTPNCDHLGPPAGCIPTDGGVSGVCQEAAPHGG